MNSIDIFDKIFFWNKKGEDKTQSIDYYYQNKIIHLERQSDYTDDDRRKYAVELLDTYKGFGKHYIKEKIKETFKSQGTREAMLNLVISLPLLKRFIESYSKVYATNPTRKFYKDNKEIVAKIDNEVLDTNKFLINEKLYNQLSSFYNNDVIISLKEAEKLTNLLNTTIYKVITDSNGEIKIAYISNDKIQVNCFDNDLTKAKSIHYILERKNEVGVKYETQGDVWNPSQYLLYNKENSEINQSGIEAIELGYKDNLIGSAFAPFIVFRNKKATNDFWNIQNFDTIEYIKNINVLLTELNFLITYTSCSSKYGVNLKSPSKNGTLDPLGMNFFEAQPSGGIPNETGSFSIGEFTNAGKIQEVINSITFNVKMLYDTYHIAIDSLISSNNVKSAENKDKDNENLNSIINQQREIWNDNEQSLFKVMQAVYNRDNQDKKIPAGIELFINFEEQENAKKTNEDMLVLIENNIITYIDWLKKENPDLDDKELKILYANNKSFNETNSKDDNSEDIVDNKDDINKKEDITEKKPREILTLKKDK